MGCVYHVGYAYKGIGCYHPGEQTPLGLPHPFYRDEYLSREGLILVRENGGEKAGVVHLTVTMVNPTPLLRMTGGLGPLGLMGLDGNMTWEFLDEEDGTRVRFTYAVGGYAKGGLDSIAPAVDYVIGEALDRLKAHIETGNPETAAVD